LYGRPLETACNGLTARFSRLDLDDNCVWFEPHWQYHVLLKALEVPETVHDFPRPSLLNKLRQIELRSVAIQRTGQRDADSAANALIVNDCLHENQPQ
jgi:hypothetical protein